MCPSLQRVAARPAWPLPSLALALWLAPAGAPLARAGEPPRLAELVQQVQAAELSATVQTLVGFGTRHTLSDTRSATRGIGAARRWVQGQLQALAAACGGCLEVVELGSKVSGPRIPKTTEVVDIVAIQRGSADPQRVVAITAHLDSRVGDIMDATSDAPGANDDASGAAAVIEAARVLSRQHPRATIVYGVLSGEEQGLYGGRILAEHARAQGWRVEADLNNDIVGNTHGGDGVDDNSVVRVFSEGTKAGETPQQAKRRRYNGGEVDSPSRNLARYVAGIAETALTNLRVEMVYRTDRYGRGGDQVAFLEAGYPAVRLSEAHEDYTRQHQYLRSEAGIRYGDTLDGVDFEYLAQVTRLNVATLAALAHAPAPPTGVAIEGAVIPDTTLKWTPMAGAAAYRVHWRATTDARWRHHREAAGDATQLVLRNTVIDDAFFGVSSLSADGFESPVVFPGPAGEF